MLTCRLLVLALLLIVAAGCGGAAPEQAALEERPETAMDTATATTPPESAADTEPATTPPEPAATDPEAATSTQDEPTGLQEGAEMQGDWYLAEADGVEGLPPPDREITMAVEATTLMGNAGCNSYTADYTLEGERIIVASVIRTEMACDPPELMRAEDAFLSALESAASMRIEDGDLVLEAADATLRFSSLLLPDDGSSGGPDGGLPDGD